MLVNIGKRRIIQEFEELCEEETLPRPLEVGRNFSPWGGLMHLGEFQASQ
jgi:hypothetical protein